MRFVRQPVINPELDSLAWMYLPDPRDHYAYAESEGPTIRVELVELEEQSEVPTSSRLLSALVVDMMMKFNREAEKRRELGHNDAVFALACLTGDPQNEVKFDAGSNGIVGSNYSSTGKVGEEPVLRDGEIAFVAKTYPRSPALLLARSGLHLCVRASALRRENEALYASMLGTGLVALHTLSEYATYHEAQIVGQVGSLSTGVDIP